MNIRYLGTAAAEGVPALFCDCRTCRICRERGGRNVRTRSQALIDDRLLIDMGPDTLMHSLTQHIDFSHLELCLITHTHEDHFVPHNLEVRRRGYAQLTPGSLPLSVYGSQETGEALATAPDGKVNADGSVLFFALSPLTPTILHDSVAGDYEVTAIPAVHGTKSPYTYLIRNQQENKTLLYAHDTSIYEDESIWRWLDEHHPHLDLVSMDCTYGNDEGEHPRHHMNLTENRTLRQLLLSHGLATEDTVFVANHFSHNGKDSVYDEMIHLENAKDFLISYDGMKIEF